MGRQQMVDHSGTVLVTGAAGFIGAAVVRELLAQGNRVIGVDNLNEAYDPRLKVWRLKHLEGNPRFTFYRIDIVDRQKMAELFGRVSDLAAVVHLAAWAGVRPSIATPWTYYETNVLGTLNLLELCREHGIRKFVFASTSSLYGAHNPCPFSEDANTDRPLSPYAASKKAAEVLCYTYHHLYGLDVTVLRYFTVYGPAGRPDMSIFRFIRWIAEGEPVVLYGDGSQKRDFTYIDDIAKGTVAALRPVGFEIVNLGGNQPVSVRHVIELIEDLLGRKAQLEIRPQHPADVPATWANTTKAWRLFGWKPQVPLQEGLKRTVDWYMENRELAREVSLE